MTGDFIDAIARRAVCRSTHRLVVLPALADLQFEVRTQSRWCAARSYAGAWRAVAGAVLHDMGVAVQRPGWRDDLLTIVGLVLMQLAYYSSMLSLALLTVNRRGGVEDFTRIDIKDIAALGLVAFVISVIPVAVLVLPHRHTDAGSSAESDSR